MSDIENEEWTKGAEPTTMGQNQVWTDERGIHHSMNPKPFSELRDKMSPEAQARVAAHTKELAESAAKAEWLVDVVRAARDMLVAAQKLAGWLPEQGDYSTKMTPMEITLAKGIADLTSVVNQCATPAPKTL